MSRIAPRILLAALLTCAAIPATAQAPNDFYLNLLKRGITSVQAGRSGEAVEPLRIAAFGMVDFIDHYQTAQIYLALALENLERREEARLAAQRVVVAERLRKTYGSLSLPAAVRSDFQRVGQLVLSETDQQLLSSSPASQPAEPAVPAAPEANPPPAAEVPSPSPSIASPNVPAESPAQPQSRPAAPLRPDVPAKLAEASRHLAGARLSEARRVYRDLLALEHDHATLLRIGEGLYRSRDFHGTLDAFRRLNLRTGEEPYRYYIAVALYETGDFAGAKRELAAALPFIEVTPDVDRYRALINAKP